MDICYINTTICLQYFSVSLHSNRFVYCAPLGTSRKTSNQNIIWELDFLKLKILILCQYRQVICHRKGKIMFFSNVYKLFRFVQYSSKYQVLNMVKLLKTMNAWHFIIPVARNLVEIKNISSLLMSMCNISFESIF